MRDRKPDVAAHLGTGYCSKPECQICRPTLQCPECHTDDAVVPYVRSSWLERKEMYDRKQGREHKANSQLIVFTCKRCKVDFGIFKDWTEGELEELRKRVDNFKLM